MNLFLIIPTLNESHNIGQLLEDILETIKPGVNFDSVKIIHVDDGSRDETIEIVNRYKSNISVIQIIHPTNLGIGITFKDGIKTVLEQASNDDLVIFLEGDMSNDPRLIPEMVTILRNEADIIIASRYIKNGGVQGFPLKRRLMSYILNLFLRFYFPIPNTTDYSIFYRGYRVSLLKKGFEYYGEQFIECKGFGANAEILCKLSRFHPVVREIPQIYRYYLSKGSSNLNISKTIKEYLTLFTQLRKMKNS